MVVPQISAAPLNGEPLLTLPQVSRRFPGARGATRSHPSKWARYIAKGARGRDGRMHRLEAVRIGHSWFTSEAALARFFAALAGDPVTTSPAPSPRPARNNGAAAGDRLEAAGW